MKKVIFSTIILFTSFLCISAQVFYEDIQSYKTNTTGQLKIKLPKGYDKEFSIKTPFNYCL